MDAYRAAFEEQLCKNKQLMVQLAEVAVSGPTRMEKAKAIIKNLVHLLNDGTKHFSQSVSSFGSATGQVPCSYHIVLQEILIFAITFLP